MTLKTANKMMKCDVDFAINVVSTNVTYMLVLPNRAAIDIDKNNNYEEIFENLFV